MPHVVAWGHVLSVLCNLKMYSILRYYEIEIERVSLYVLWVNSRVCELCSCWIRGQCYGISCEFLACRVKWHGTEGSCALMYYRVA